MGIMLLLFYIEGIYKEIKEHCDEYIGDEFEG